MFKDKLKQLLPQKQDEGEDENKKKIENIVFCIAILIITILAINLILNGQRTANSKEKEEDTTKRLASQETTIETSNTENGEDSLEKKLETILSKIQGVGEVKVFINYSESSEVVAMYNENTKTSNTEENDTEGGIRKIQETDSQKDIIYKEENGEKVPITKKVVQPKVEGAIITAKGANSVEIKNNIIQAVEAVTGLATHKIQVFEMN